jgi:RNA polymerase sigma-70 factor (ECF subfamily)
VSTDNKVIERSVGSPEEFAALFDRHAVKVHRYAARPISPQVADDIVSETFLVAFDKRTTFDLNVVHALPWLLGIATTLLKQQARREAIAWKGMVAEIAADVVPDAIELAGARMDAERSVKRITTALRRLSPGDRDVVLLYAWGDLDYAGIALALDIPVGTVRSRLNRARRLLRSALDIAIDKEIFHGRTDTAPQRSY